MRKTRSTEVQGQSGKTWVGFRLCPKAWAGAEAEQEGRGAVGTVGKGPEHQALRWMSYQDWAGAASHSALSLSTEWVLSSGSALDK